MKILITGGHFSPAYALIQKIKNEHQVVVVGRRTAFEGDSAESFEYKVCREEEIPFIHLPTGRLQRKMTRHTIPSLLKIPGGLTRAIAILKKERPDVVVTFGGYIAVPVVLAAKSLDIPVVLHEQTLHIGFANKIAAKFSDVICVSYEESKKYFQGKKTILTGLPIRKEVFEIHKKFPVPPGKNVLYFTGGSTGSHAINDFVRRLLPELLSKYVIIHQTGDSSQFNDYDKSVEYNKTLASSQSESYIVKKFITPDEIGWVYSVTDIVISRAGANTVAELMALSKRAILIPLPGGQSGEQKTNAEYLQKNGNAIVLDQSLLSKDQFLTAVTKVEQFPIKKNKIYSQAVENLVQVIEDLYEKKKHEKKT